MARIACAALVASAVMRFKTASAEPLRSVGVNGRRVCPLRVVWRFWRVVACLPLLLCVAFPLGRSTRALKSRLRGFMGFRGIIARVGGFSRVLGLFSGLLVWLRLRGASSEPFGVRSTAQTVGASSRLGVPSWLALGSSVSLSPSRSYPPLFFARV